MSLTATSNRDAALSLASSGLHIFPCEEGGPRAKQPKPFIKWRDVSTTDTRQVGEWWRRWPNAAIGVDLGKSGHIVIDCDRHGEHDGVEAFGALMGAHGFDPDAAPLVATPSEGNHHWFRQRDGEALGNGRGELPAGIDVRGSGGYVIAPGTTMADGRAYELFGDLADAPAIPDWLHAIVTARRAPIKAEVGIPASEDRSLDELRDLLAAISPDIGYHEWLECLMAVHAETGGSGSGLALVDDWSARGSKYAGTKELAAKWRSFKRSGISGATLAEIARRHGADLSAIAIRHKGHADAYDPIEAATAARLLIESVDGTLADAETGEVVEPEHVADDAEDFGGSKEYVDFPDEKMNPGGVVGEIMEWICETTGEPIRIHALGAALITVGTILSRKVYSRSRPTGTHLYIGAICPSGIGKDHPQSCIKRVLDTLPRHTGSSLHAGWASSAPKLGVRLNECAGAVMIADEFAEKLASTRSRNASTSMTAINEALKEIWGRSQGSYELPGALSRSDIVIQRPGMSFYGAATIRDFKEALISKDVTSGLYNRFIFLPRYATVPMMPETEGMVTVPEIITARCRWMYGCLTDLDEVNSRRGDTYPGNPVMVPFTVEAQAINEDNRAYQKVMQAKSDEDAVLSLYGRYAEQIKRVALIIACGKSPEFLRDAVIGEAEMTFARDLIKWSIEQTILMVRRDMVENQWQAQGNLVMGAIRSAKKITQAALYRKVNGRIKRRDIEDIIIALERAGSIAIIVSGDGKPGRPATSYRYLRG